MPLWDSHTNWAGQEALLLRTRPALLQPVGNMMTSKFGSGVAEPAAHLLADVKKNGIRFDFVERVEKKTICCQVPMLKVYTKVRQTMSLILGMNIP